eukprot:scaffold59427_cov78-Phaeocystis_antarctica.AAC.1
MLQPIAIGIIISAGHGGLLHEGRKRRGPFVCSVNFIRELIKERGWKNVRPCGDTRKVPDNYVTLRWLMVLRLAYFVLVHSIPHELCLNGDHTLASCSLWPRGRCGSPRPCTRARTSPSTTTGRSGSSPCSQRPRPQARFCLIRSWLRARRRGRSRSPASSRSLSTA